jgi:hypothetical protein
MVTMAHHSWVRPACRLPLNALVSTHGCLVGGMANWEKGKSMNGDNGHSENDVLYIGFPGSVSDTVKQHANWGAKNFEDFESSIKDVGDKLAARL